jgi:hypothetical protein
LPSNSQSQLLFAVDTFDFVKTLVEDTGQVRRRVFGFPGSGVILGFEDGDSLPSLCKQQSGGQPGNASADDTDVAANLIV